MAGGGGTFPARAQLLDGDSGSLLFNFPNREGISGDDKLALLHHDHRGRERLIIQPLNTPLDEFCRVDVQLVGHTMAELSPKRLKLTSIEDLIVARSPSLAGI